MSNEIGLDFEALIQTPVFDEIWLYVLQSGLDQTIKSVKAKMPDLDLSFLKDEDDVMVDAKVAQKGVEEIAKQDQALTDGNVEKEVEHGSEAPPSVEGGPPADLVDSNLIS